MKLNRKILESSRKFKKTIEVLNERIQKLFELLVLIKLTNNPCKKLNLKKTSYTKQPFNQLDFFGLHSLGKHLTLLLKNLKQSNKTLIQILPKNLNQTVLLKPLSLQSSPREIRVTFEVTFADPLQSFKFQIGISFFDYFSKQNEWIKSSFKTVIFKPNRTELFNEGLLDLRKFLENLDRLLKSLESQHNQLLIFKLTNELINRLQSNQSGDLSLLSKSLQTSQNISQK